MNWSDNLIFFHLICDPSSAAANEQPSSTTNRQREMVVIMPKDDRGGAGGVQAELRLHGRSPDRTAYTATNAARRLAFRNGSPSSPRGGCSESGANVIARF